MNNIEVEIKFPLLNEVEVMMFLAKNGEFKYESQQLDYYYNAPHRDFVENPKNICEWIRLRVSNNKYELNYKDWQPHTEIIKTHCNEFETEISSLDDMKHILEALNFKPLITVDKVRKVWMLKNNVEISIDTIENLGSFIELEYKGKEFNDIQKIRVLLFDTLKELGAETKDIDLKGYPFLMLEKEGYFK